MQGRPGGRTASSLSLSAAVVQLSHTSTAHAPWRPSWPAAWRCAPPRARCVPRNAPCDPVGYSCAARPAVPRYARRPAGAPAQPDGRTHAIFRQRARQRRASRAAAAGAAFACQLMGCHPDWLDVAPHRAAARAPAPMRGAPTAACGSLRVPALTRTPLPRRARRRRRNQCACRLLCQRPPPAGALPCHASQLRTARRCGRPSDASRRRATAWCRPPAWRSLRAARRCAVRPHMLRSCSWQAENMLRRGSSSAV
jgi:hypothetical protein